MPSPKHAPGIRTRLLLQISVAAIIAATMALSLLVVRSRMRSNVQQQLHEDLQHSLMTFQDLQARRRTSLERENGLLATLPTLRALMTTHDRATIQDSSKDFWKLSGNELFALADSDGKVLAAYAQGAPNRTELQGQLQTAIGNPQKHYVFACGRLYEYSVTRIYFGTTTNGTLLGYVIGGYAVDHELLREVGRGAGAEGIFFAGDRIAASTLPSEHLNEAAALANNSSGTFIHVGKERYLAASRDLSASADVSLRLVVLKSLVAADRAEHEIRSVVLLGALLAIGFGSVLMLLLARTVTAPLERLSRAVHAFAGGDKDYKLPSKGPQEVRHLSAVLADMRDEIQKKNQALLESERLATIGRMASSVSHDLRHYLAAIYANSEFLASPKLSPEERAELFEEIRLAVHGTTDMLDSLLLFGSTGSAVRRVAVPMNEVVERAVALVRAHPDAERVTLRSELAKGDTTAEIDARQVERAIYNLLLNACQSASESPESCNVIVSVEVDCNRVAVTVRDTGAGVPEGIRQTLFDPFVSKGKQKGTGLGLTLAHSVANEHRGDVELVSSHPGETIFRLSVERETAAGLQSSRAAESMVLS